MRLPEDFGAFDFQLKLHDPSR